MTFVLTDDEAWAVERVFAEIRRRDYDLTELQAALVNRLQLHARPTVAKVIDGVVHCGACDSTKFRYDESHPTQSSMRGWLACWRHEGMKLVFHGNFEWYDGDDTPGVICASCETIADVPSGVSVDFD